MTGSYVISKRVLDSPTIPSGLQGALGSAGTEVIIAPFTSGYQETRSWRTSSRGAERDQDLTDARRIFRNGFSTFDQRFDRGHEFSTVRRTITATFPNTYVRYRDRNGSSRWYRGPFIPNMTGATQTPPWVNPPVMSDAEAVTVGQRAINNCAPTAPQASAATFIGELFAGLPQMVGASLWKSQIRDYRAIGGEYLNVQFGWVPFLNDLRKVAKNLRDSSRILSQLQRDNGRVVRRRFRFPLVQSSTYASYYPTGFYRSDVVYGETPSPRAYSKTTRTERETWFSGAFSYAIPTGDNLWEKLEGFEAKANILLGTRVTPEVVWNLAPWSWLVDWKFGIGDALSTASMLQNDGLVIRYGYLMERNLTEVTYSSGPVTYGDFGDRVPASFVTLRSESKKRIRATPYGFGVDTGALSDSQWLILAALGMTRGPRTLA